MIRAPLRIPLALAAVAAGASLALTACSSGEGPDGPEGSWGRPDARELPSLEFEPADAEGAERAERGDYTGTDGCNRLGGEYTVEGDLIDLGMMRSTLIFCEGVDTWLSLARTARIEPGSPATMTFYDENDEEIGSLERTD
ncbi:META domain-containing protein [Leucobacter sp. CSA1]|uniref:META domain-containing protein n=1 Tax=Leucobacter chromiisoli TaxID=2796471 RepID=A0A934UVP3_9MICO|nr:META domain-containing protein [Leucobacter chromiisoli]MBK0419691.1 META domain-containing protein [Leucobacter chromiisoli]